MWRASLKIRSDVINMVWGGTRSRNTTLPHHDDNCETRQQPWKVGTKLHTQTWRCCVFHFKFDLSKCDPTECGLNVLPPMFCYCLEFFFSLCHSFVCGWIALRHAGPALINVQQDAASYLTGRSQKIALWIQSSSNCLLIWQFSDCRFPNHEDPFWHICRALDTVPG